MSPTRIALSTLVPSARLPAMNINVEQALQVIEDQLRAVNDELEPQEREVTALREKLEPLERKVVALQRKREEFAAAATHLRNALETADPADGADESEVRFDNGEEVGEQASRPKTIDGVLAILSDLGGSASMEDIRREFRERGWLDPSFKTPDAALYAAAKRLTQGGRVERLGAGNYRLLPQRWVEGNQT
jgi:hypothetical protein